jgi:hypothetical protein
MTGIGGEAMSGPHSARDYVMTVLHFLGHLILSAIGVPVIASVLRYSILLSLQQFYPSLSFRAGQRMEWILMETPYFPVQILIGLLLGFQLSRRYRHKVMLWTWIVPALTIALLVLFAPFPPMVISGVEITKADHFFGWSCLPQNHCYEQTGVTLPLYAAAAYSLGAFLARVIPITRRGKTDGRSSSRRNVKAETQRG